MDNFCHSDENFSWFWWKIYVILITMILMEKYNSTVESSTDPVINTWTKKLRYINIVQW